MADVEEARPPLREAGAGGALPLGAQSTQQHIVLLLDVDLPISAPSAPGDGSSHPPAGAQQVAGGAVSKSAVFEAASRTSIALSYMSPHGSTSLSIKLISSKSAFCEDIFNEFRIAANKDAAVQRTVADVLRGKLLPYLDMFEQRRAAGAGRSSASWLSVMEAHMVNCVPPAAKAAQEAGGAAAVYFVLLTSAISAEGVETEHVPKWTEDVAARLRAVNARFVVLDPCSAGEAPDKARQRLAAALQAGLDTARGAEAGDKQAAVVQLARFLSSHWREGGGLSPHPHLGLPLRPFAVLHVDDLTQSQPGKSMDAARVIQPLVTEDFTPSHASYSKMFGPQFSFDFSPAMGLGNDHWLRTIEKCRRLKAPPLRFNTEAAKPAKASAAAPGHALKGAWGKRGAPQHARPPVVPPPAAKPQPQPGRGVLGNPLGGSAKMNVQAAMRTSGKPGGSAGPMAKPMKPPSSSQPGGSQGAGHGPAGGRSGGMSAGRGAAGGGGSKGPPGEGSAAAHGAAKGAKVAKPPMRPPIGGEGGAAAAMGAGAGSYGGVGKRLRQQVEQDLLRTNSMSQQLPGPAATDLPGAAAGSSAAGAPGGAAGVPSGSAAPGTCAAGQPGGGAGGVGSQRRWVWPAPTSEELAAAELRNLVEVDDTLDVVALMQRLNSEMLEFVGGDLKAEVRRLEKQARKQAAGARGQQEQPQQQDPGVPAPGGEQGQGCAPAGTEAAVAAAAGPAGDDGGAEADVEDDGDRDSGEPEQRPAKRRRKGPKGEKVKMQLGNIRSRVLCKLLRTRVQHQPKSEGVVPGWQPPVELILQRARQQADGAVHSLLRASEAAVAAAVREEKRQAAERKAQRRARTRLGDEPAEECGECDPAVDPDAATEPQAEGAAGVRTSGVGAEGKEGPAGGQQPANGAEPDSVYAAALDQVYGLLQETWLGDDVPHRLAESGLTRGRPRLQLCALLFSACRALYAFELLGFRKPKVRTVMEALREQLDWAAPAMCHVEGQPSMASFVTEHLLPAWAESWVRPALELTAVSYAGEDREGINEMEFAMRWDPEDDWGDKEQEAADVDVEDLQAWRERQQQQLQQTSQQQGGSELRVSQRMVSGSQGRAPAAGQSGRLNMSGSAGVGGTAGGRVRLGAAGPVPGAGAAGNNSSNGRQLQVSEVDSKKGVVLLGGPKLPGGSRIAKHLVQLDASRPAHMAPAMQARALIHVAPAPPPEKLAALQEERRLKQRCGAATANLAGMFDKEATPPPQQPPPSAPQSQAPGTAPLSLPPAAQPPATTTAAPVATTAAPGAAPAAAPAGSLPLQKAPSAGHPSGIPAPSGAGAGDAGAAAPVNLSQLMASPPPRSRGRAGGRTPGGTPRRTPRGRAGRGARVTPGRGRGAGAAAGAGSAGGPAPSASGTSASEVGPTPLEARMQSRLQGAGPTALVRGLFSEPAEEGPMVKYNPGGEGPFGQVATFQMMQRPRATAGPASQAAPLPHTAPAATAGPFAAVETLAAPGANNATTAVAAAPAAACAAAGPAAAPAADVAAAAPAVELAASPVAGPAPSVVPGTPAAAAAKAVGTAAEPPALAPAPAPAIPEDDEGDDAMETERELQRQLSGACADQSVSNPNKEGWAGGEEGGDDANPWASDTETDKNCPAPDACSPMRSNSRGASRLPSSMGGSSSQGRPPAAKAAGAGALGVRGGVTKGGRGTPGRPRGGASRIPGFAGSRTLRCALPGARPIVREATASGAEAGAAAAEGAAAGAPEVTGREQPAPAAGAQQQQAEQPGVQAGEQQDAGAGAAQGTPVVAPEAGPQVPAEAPAALERGAALGAAGEGQEGEAMAVDAVPASYGKVVGGQPDGEVAVGDADVDGAGRVNAGQHADAPPPEQPAVAGPDAAAVPGGAAADVEQQAAEKCTGQEAGADGVATEPAGATSAAAAPATAAASVPEGAPMEAAGPAPIGEAEVPQPQEHSDAEAADEHVAQRPTRPQRTPKRPPAAKTPAATAKKAARAGAKPPAAACEALSALVAQTPATTTRRRGAAASDKTPAPPATQGKGAGRARANDQAGKDAGPEEQEEGPGEGAPMALPPGVSEEVQVSCGSLTGWLNVRARTVRHEVKGKEEVIRAGAFEKLAGKATSKWKSTFRVREDDGDTSFEKWADARGLTRDLLDKLHAEWKARAKSSSALAPAAAAPTPAPSTTTNTATTTKRRARGTTVDPDTGSESESDADEPGAAAPEAGRQVRAADAAETEGQGGVGAAAGRGRSTKRRRQAADVDAPCDGAATEADPIAVAVGPVPGGAAAPCPAVEPPQTAEDRLAGAGPRGSHPAPITLDPAAPSHALRLPSHIAAAAATLPHCPMDGPPSFAKTLKRFNFESGNTPFKGLDREQQQQGQQHSHLADPGPLAPGLGPSQEPSAARTGAREAAALASPATALPVGAGPSMFGPSPLQLAAGSGGEGNSSRYCALTDPQLGPLARLVDGAEIASNCQQQQQQQQELHPARDAPSQGAPEQEHQHPAAAAPEPHQDAALASDSGQGPAGPAVPPAAPRNAPTQGGAGPGSLLHSESEAEGASQLGQDGLGLADKQSNRVARSKGKGSKRGGSKKKGTEDGAQEAGDTVVPAAVQELAAVQPQGDAAPAAAQDAAAKRPSGQEAGEVQPASEAVRAAEAATAEELGADVAKHGKGGRAKRRRKGGGPASSQQPSELTQPCAAGADVGEVPAAKVVEAAVATRPPKAGEGEGACQAGAVDGTVPDTTGPSGARMETSEPEDDQQELGRGRRSKKASAWLQEATEAGTTTAAAAAEGTAGGAEAEAEAAAGQRPKRSSSRRQAAASEGGTGAGPEAGAGGVEATPSSRRRGKGAEHGSAAAGGGKGAEAGGNRVGDLSPVLEEEPKGETEEPSVVEARGGRGTKVQGEGNGKKGGGRGRKGKKDPETDKEDEGDDEEGQGQGQQQQQLVAPTPKQKGRTRAAASAPGSPQGAGASECTAGTRMTRSRAAGAGGVAVAVEDTPATRAGRSKRRVQDGEGAEEPQPQTASKRARR